MLVVDDAPDLRFLITLLLEDEPDWTVVGEAANGAQAVESATEHTPDLVIIDAAMPVMGGIEALPRLRELLPGSLLVMVTAFPRGQLESAAADAGADACLDKLNLVEQLVPSLRLLVRDWERSGSRSDSRV